MPKTARLIVVFLVLLMFAGCAKPKNSTIIGAAEMWVEAMVTANPELMDEVNRSESWEYPTTHLMRMANEQGWVGLDPAEFTYERAGNAVAVTHPEKEVRLEFITLNNLWYFAGFYQGAMQTPEEPDVIRDFASEGKTGDLDLPSPGLVRPPEGEYMRVGYEDLPVRFAPYRGVGLTVYRVYYDPDDYLVEREGQAPFCHFYMEYETPEPYRVTAIWNIFNVYWFSNEPRGPSQERVYVTSPKTRDRLPQPNRYVSRFRVPADWVIETDEMLVRFHDQVLVMPNLFADEI